MFSNMFMFSPFFTWIFFLWGAPLNVLVRYNLYIFLECLHTLLMTEADNRKEGLVFFTSHLILAQ